jgi:uncharacterized protein YjaZ
MGNVEIFIAQASGTLGKHTDKIMSAFASAVKTAKNINLSAVDVIVTDNPYGVIPEMGVGGYTPGTHVVYLSIDPKFDLKEQEISLTLIHEFHHAMRWRGPGYGKTFKEALVTEGLACLYEEQVSGTAPIYTQVDIKDAAKTISKDTLNDNNYPHHELFINGNNDVPRWFGYTLGYKIAKHGAGTLKMSAAELVNEPYSSFDKSVRALVESESADSSDA